MSGVLQETNKLTPMLRQYYDLKKQCDGAILFFRMGDFYELFGDDAQLVAPILNIVLTSREKGDQQERIPFCGVPHHSAKAYYRKLLQKGFKVAIAEQVQDAKESKGLVERKVTTIYTPGIVDDSESIEQNRSNYVFSIYEDPITKDWYGCTVELSTATMKIGKFQGFSSLLNYCLSIRPKEIWCRTFIKKNLLEIFQNNGYECSFEELKETVLRSEPIQDTILGKIFSIEHSSHKLLKDLPLRSLVSAVLERITYLGHDCERFKTLENFEDSKTFDLSLQTQRDLEVFETQLRRDQEGSLFSIINYCKTGMGSRLLSENLRAPLTDHNEILQRHQFLSFLLTLGGTKLDVFRKLLAEIGDIERIITRVVSNKAKPSELSALRKSLSAGLNLLELFEGCGATSNEFVRKFKAASGEICELHLLLDKALVKDVSDLGSGDKVFADSFNEELSRLNYIAKNGQASVDEYMKRLKSIVGISNLKIKEHKTYGLLIEVTKSNLSKIPDSFIRKQTMVNNERFTTTELERLSDDVFSSLEKAVQLESELYFGFIRDLSRHFTATKIFSSKLAMLDMMISFAYISLKFDFKPVELLSAGAIHLEECRHPVIERFVGRNFVPNSIHLPIHKKQMLITGPNMAGKSTIMRQLAVAALLNQIGCFVPASGGKLPIFDQIYTRIGAADDLALGKSTFMVEMSETAHILKYATSRSLVILDEIGRGTSTQDGLALASAILLDLVERVDAYVLFATHYHELVPFASRMASVQVMQTQVIQSDHGVEFSHKLIEGACGNSFGIEVAKLAGLSNHVIINAQKSLIENKKFTDNKIIQDKSDLVVSEKQQEMKLGRLAGRDPGVVSDIVNKIEMLKVHRLTPLAALNILNDFKTQLEQPGQLELPFEAFLE